ncbi:MAG: hypothetical protein H5T34_04325 [Candidatus Methanomethyliales bacterium]|nr:hypothetical protein [Candidatus Methanomethylicales archaeon]
MGMILVNPRTFLPLLLFIGFVYTLIGIGTSKVSVTTGVDLPNLFTIGEGIIALSVLLFVMTAFVRILMRR